MSIQLDRLTKYFGGHCVVNNVSLEVPAGELFVLLGPSGSGKSTVLRMIAGLIETDEGRVLIGGRDMTRLSPQRRGVGLVFQNYALFRHMTAAANIEFPLTIRKVNATERRKRRDELLEIVGLIGFEDRYPHQLSGGQQQRVALARALAHRPEVLLLDEPFGALDAKIRAELRRSLRKIQNELGVTTVFVTHDQEEAFELADRTAVMNFGRLLEVGPPMELYLHPQTEFVATFLGRANLMVGGCDASSVSLGAIRFPLDDHITSTGGERRVQVLFRPEDVAVKDTSDALRWPLLGKARVDEVGFAGSVEKIRLRLPPLPGVRTISPSVLFGADHILVEATRSQHQAHQHPLRPGDDAWVGVRRIHALLHPGLSMLLVTDRSPHSQAAETFGERIVRLAHARVTLLGSGEDGEGVREHLDRIRERMGSGPAAVEILAAAGPEEEAIRRETDRRPYDLLICGRPPEGVLGRIEEYMAGGDHHLLLIPGPCPLPRRVLICVAVGEPGKEDILFAGRLVRHLGASATILHVLPKGAGAAQRSQCDRFLAAGARTLAVLGVPGETAVREGRPEERIVAAVEEDRFDLVVVGTPIPRPDGRIHMTGLSADLVKRMENLPVLLVRSTELP